MTDTRARQRDWLALWRTPGIGALRFVRLLEELGSPTAVLAENASALRALGLTDNSVAYLRAPDWARVDADLAWLDGDAQRHLLLWDDPRYPANLKEIHDPPPLLFVCGDVDVLAQPQLAVVGTRNPSPTGERCAFEFAAALSTMGLTVTSGLAQGIDAAAHRGALSVGGLTVAVAGTGPDRVYPAAHLDLAHQIVANGAIVTELPPGTPLSRGNFPRRNRLISGLAWGVLVVEAAAESGSLITARLAMEQGREVFAIPGSIHNPSAKGCHALIRQGAQLVDCVDDIVQELRGFAAQALNTGPVASLSQETLGLSEDHHALLKWVAYEPTSVDTLVTVSGETPEAVASMLLLLELEGHIASVAGGCYHRLK